MLAWTAAARADEPVRFGRDVLPILSTHCSACHGPDEKERKANLRLDVEADAKAKHESGFPIVPGKPGESTVLARIQSKDPKKVMPPPDAHHPIKPAEVEVLRRWIAQGAPWGRHWSFEPVVRPEMPILKSHISTSDLPATGNRQSAIDSLVAARLAKKNLQLQPPAGPHTLVRRLYLDLIGIPPSPETADRFAADPTPAAYANLVDELLASPRFGEHWARTWLDLARYADTKGYEKDLGRTMWPWRDWVIQALNRDMPLTRFTEEQLAGDLLPDPTDDQMVATAFHRNTMVNDEGGTDDEEYRVAAVKDRVDSTMQVWMGLTMGCAKCHTHKYDPISISEYYSFYAIFNQTQDADRSDDTPTLPIPGPDHAAKAAGFEERIAKLRAAVGEAERGETRPDAGEGPWAAPRAAATSQHGATCETQPDGSILVGGHRPDTDVYTVTLSLPAGTHTALRLEALPASLPAGKQGVGRSPADPNFVVSEFTAELIADGKPRALKFSGAKSGFAQDKWPVAAAIDGKPETGWAVSPRKYERHVAIFTLDGPLKLEKETPLRVVLTQQYGSGLTLGRFRLSTTGGDAATLSPTSESPALQRLRTELATVQDEQKKFVAALPKVPVMRELGQGKQRVTKVHVRGNFLDQVGVVTAGVPVAFGALPAGLPTNRLAVAQWLVSAENPLTPRVWANRVWARIFGIGIVETEEDFGALGSPPTNPELLDWLAAEYRDNGWSLKKLLKTIVTSATYQQASGTTPELREADPRNQLHSRGARHRLTAEMIRDQALETAGLLSRKMYGPPVMPPQPAGLWRSTYSGTKWVDAGNEDRWRRGLYTYAKRTTPYPSLIAFDGGSREVCLIRRINSNTPLQAFVTLNDPVYLEAAASLAKRMVTEAKDDAGRAARGLRLALIRPAGDGDIAPLLKLKQDMQAEFDAAPERAEALLKTGRITAPEGVRPAELAAWMVAANAILNLDEFLNRN